jgi:2-methylisocitrate lyase-like PEP mutase family enzyme
MNTESTNQLPSAGARLREILSQAEPVPFIGVYDSFSAGLAGRQFDSLFVSGFGFAASYYGLPDIGFITWTDIVAFVQRVRTILPRHNILVDIDDGYCDPEVACHVVSLLETSGASGVVLEDQKRPRCCGHFEGKQIMDLDEYLSKLHMVLNTRKELFVVARTDASDPHEAERRARAFADAGADAVLIDGLPDLGILRRLSKDITKPICFNQIAGGKSPPHTLSELRDAGVSLVIYSTPCLFAAQPAIEASLSELKMRDGMLAENSIGVHDCTSILTDNLTRAGQRNGSECSSAARGK